MKPISYTILFFLLSFSVTNAQVLDSSYGTNGKTLATYNGEFEEVNSALLQPDGKLLMGGYNYDEFFYFPQINIARFDPNGEPDTSFGLNGFKTISGSPFGGSEYGGYLALQPDNKIVGLGTDFDRDDLERDQIVLFRLKPNGDYDSSFGMNGKSYTNFGNFSNIAGALLLKPDGKIVVAGNLPQNHKGAKSVELAQFLSNGKLDSSFGTHGIVENGTNHQLQGVALALLPNNKILSGFLYVDPNGGGYKNCLIKYNANGTIDSSFGTKGVVLNNNSTSSSGKMSLAIQGDGKIVEYVVGSPLTNSIYRYNANGKPDHTFGINGMISTSYFPFSLCVILDKSQRILINQYPFSAARYLHDGTIDSSFGVNGEISTDFSDIIPGSYAVCEQLVLQPNSKIILAGYVDEANGLQTFGAARFKSVTAQEAKSASSLIIALYPNPATSTLNIKGLDANSKYSLSIIDAQGNIKAVKQVSNTSTCNWNIQNLNTGSYYLNVTSGTLISTSQFFKQ